MKSRTISKITKNSPHPGFLGEGHTATAVIEGTDFRDSDPFIFLMDDRLNLPGGPPVGGAHPHAGFETVTFILQGDGHEWKTGSLELMTAGRGIVHTEEITAETKVRILQLWLALPPDQRWAEPFFQKIDLENVPMIKQPGVEARVYSGSSHGLTSPLKNRTPWTLIDVTMEKNSEFAQDLPGSYNGFIYVIDGSVSVADKNVRREETAWLDRADQSGEGKVIFRTQGESSRLLLYAGQPHHVTIVSHGPFIGDTQDDIRRLYSEYRQGKMPHVNDLPEDKKITHRLFVPRKELPTGQAGAAAQKMQKE
jgi:redox-sensitive bicupin YhaK (pirin superfamily)